MKWMLKETLKRHKLSAYQLRKASGLSVNTVYPMVRGEAERVSLATLDRVIETLRELSGERVVVGDVLEYEG